MPAQYALGQNFAEVIRNFMPPYPTLSDVAKSPNKAPYRRMNKSKPDVFSNSLNGTRERMAHQMAALLNQFSGVSIRNLFIVAPEQITTLEELGIDDDIMHFIQSANTLAKPGIMHYLEDHLKAIETVPPTIPGQGADWTAWWLIWAKGHIGVFRFNRAEHETEATLRLKQAILAMGRRAMQNLPDVAYVARFLSPKEPASLAQIFTTRCHVANLAANMGIPADQLPYVGQSPEEVAQELEATQTPYRRDMGTIRDLGEVKKHLSELGVKGVYTCRRTNTWHTRNRSEGYMIPVCAPVAEHQVPDLMFRQHQAEPQDQDLPGISQAEHDLIHIHEPFNADQRSGRNQTDLTTYNNTVHLALMFGLTTKAVIQFMESPEPDPPAEEHPQCPFAQECHSTCGHFQRHGLRPFPMTHDGSFESCRYWAFLCENRNKEPRARELSAEIALKKANQDLKKMNPDPEPDPDPDLFENMEEEDPQQQYRQPANINASQTQKDRPKPAETVGQQSLF